MEEKSFDVLVAPNIRTAVKEMNDRKLDGDSVKFIERNGEDVIIIYYN